MTGVCIYMYMLHAHVRTCLNKKCVGGSLAGQSNFLPSLASQPGGWLVKLVTPKSWLERWQKCYTAGILFLVWNVAITH
jgi:hypothetical protein